MGYRSQVSLKTTTEGWVLMKKFNDSIENETDKPLFCATIRKTSTGNYRIDFDWIKWYDTYTQVQNFEKMLCTYGEKDIPYSFIRIGEDYNDIEHIHNWIADAPDSILDFCPETTVYDDDESSYEEVVLETDESEHKKGAE